MVTAAAAILLIDRAPQGAEHLKQILTGNVLTTGLSELTAIVPLYAAIGLLHWTLRRRAAAAGQGSWSWEFFFYASFGVVVTSSVAIAGVLLVFSFLIMPAAIGVLYSERLSSQLAIGWAVGSLPARGLPCLTSPISHRRSLVCRRCLRWFASCCPFCEACLPCIVGLRVGVVLAVFVASGLPPIEALPRADQPCSTRLGSCHRCVSFFNGVRRDLRC